MVFINKKTDFKNAGLIALATTLIKAMLAIAPIVAIAQVKPAGQVVSGPLPPWAHPWQAAPRRDAAEAYFTNLADGDKVEMPFRATFGLSSGWGLAVITSPTAGKSGHHHLLINRELPADIQKPLPFSDQYIHFGKGQMEALLNLEPGQHTLRLLLANSQHVLQFVYSKPIKITVMKKDKSIDPKSLVRKGISMLNIAEDAKLTPPFKVGFHASGLNVAHLSQNEKDTGHFRLTLTPTGAGKPAEMDFVNGQTEVWLAPPPGGYVMKLDLIDNANPDKRLTQSFSIAVRVE